MNIHVVSMTAVAVVCYHIISAAGGCSYVEIFPGLHFI